MNSNLEKVKIVVVGDSGIKINLFSAQISQNFAYKIGITKTGVGKTSLVHLICHTEVLKKTSWTIGASVEVKVNQILDIIALKEISNLANYKAARIQRWHSSA